MPDWQQIANEYWAHQPSPHEPTLTNAEFTQAVKMATVLKFGGHATPAEAKNFHQEFAQLNKALTDHGKLPLTPQDFIHQVRQIAPVSYAYHGRPPSMAEIKEFHVAGNMVHNPAAVRQYYENLPDQHHPDVTAGRMVSALAAAKPHANQQLQRDPNKSEARYLIHSGESPSDYYRRLAQPAASVPSETQPVQNVVPGERNGLQPQRR